jgi:hypothetical protein
MAALVIAAATGATSLAGCGPSTRPAPGTCKAGLLPGDLVITEVFADVKAPSGGTGTDTGKEWFEIYNAKGAPIDLDGVTITHSRPDGSRASTHTLTQATIAPGQFFTLGNAAPDLVPPYVDHGYGTDLGDFYNTGGGKLTLSCGDDEIDSASYDGVTEGHSRELTGAVRPDYTANDSPSSWCQANDTEFEAGNFGTPGTDNDCQPIVTGQCNDHGTMRDAVAPGPGDLVITEVMPSPTKVSDPNGEWFEAKVMSDVDLNGVGLDRAGDAIKPDIITSTDCLRVTAGSYVVFAKAAMAVNGGLPADAIANSFKFALVAGNGTTGDVAILAGTTVVDAVTWTRSTTGKALQLDPSRSDAIANDDESNFCDATATYGEPSPPPDNKPADLGTPGAANSRCATLPGPGMCEDSGGLRRISTPKVGELVISELLANPANLPRPPPPEPPPPGDAQREWFEIANTGPGAFDLNELVIGRIATPGAPVQSARCISVPAGGFAVFARQNEPMKNGKLPPVAATFRFTLVDTNGDIQISTGTTVLDAVTWTSVTPGVTKQLDPAHLDPTANDDAANFCAGTRPYGDMTNQGTPGAANLPCP